MIEMHMPPTLTKTYRAVGRRALALRYTAMAYLVIVAMSMSVAAGLSKLQAPSPANQQPSADCHRDAASGCVRPTLV